MADDTDSAAIEHLCRAYVDAINRQDCHAVARLFSFPAMMGGVGQPPLAVPDEAAYVQLIEATLDQFRSRGWVRTGIDELHTLVTAGGTGFVSIAFTRYRGDGSVLDSGGATYVTLRREDRWTLIAAMG